MKNLAYQLLKLWVKAGLYLYYGRIEIHGLENVPADRPVLFLPNHQGALMDVLLIVTDCHRKPYFLTRSDVFANHALVKFFSFLRMLPIYRMRDGRDAIPKNEAVFDQCAQLFSQGQAIVVFPEANHNYKRHVRPLSKGFTRIVFNALNRDPSKSDGLENRIVSANSSDISLDNPSEEKVRENSERAFEKDLRDENPIHIIPIGMNYVKNDGFPDRVSLYYGEGIVAKDLYDRNDENASATRLKNAVYNQLKGLTTHIGNELDYDSTIQKLDALRADYLKPYETNEVVDVLKSQKVGTDTSGTYTRRNPSWTYRASRKVLKMLFRLLNFPILAIWQIWIKPKVWEREFTSTLRFGFGLLVYPLYYAILFTIFAVVWNVALALFSVVAIFVINRFYVRWG